MNNRPNETDAAIRHQTVQLADESIIHPVEIRLCTFRNEVP